MEDSFRVTGNGNREMGSNGFKKWTCAWRFEASGSANSDESLSSGDGGGEREEETEESEKRN